MYRNYISGVRLNACVPQGSYLTALPVIQQLERKELLFEKPVTFFVGENGTGKSTLLEAIAVAFGFNAEGGSRNFNFSTVHTESTLCQNLTLLRRAYPKDGFFLRAESFYNVASNIDQMDAALLNSYGGVSLHAQSHGESFLALVQNRFGGDGLYILDEPEAALSPSRLLILLAEIDRLVHEHSQFLIATHSPILMAYPQADILELSQDGICSVPYKQTQHYQLTRRFLENPEKMLQDLLHEHR